MNTVGVSQLMEKSCLEVMVVQPCISLILKHLKSAIFDVAVSKQVVYYKGQQVYNLNELEYINGEIWANVYQTDCIARISPKDGFLGWILLQNLRKELLKAGNRGIDVLNGIAWDGEQKRIFVTGKLWPKLYEVKVFPIKEPIEERVIEQLCLRVGLDSSIGSKV
ncbi:unnamed protein product [Lupinus luteus]|uniref:Glutaminyl-peptide cyclotransferase n=1 Tax=Lupinus luteus TaxID=3873 RepID=A0AAV1YK13_LUPLU